MLHKKPLSKTLENQTQTFER